MPHYAENPRMSSLRAVGGLCLEVSLGAWEPDPFLDHFFSDRKGPPLQYRKKLMQNWVRRPRPKRDLETQTTYSYSPQTCKLGNEDSQFSGAYALQVWS